MSGSGIFQDGVLHSLTFTTFPETPLSAFALSSCHSRGGGWPRMGRQECLVAPCTSGGRHDVDLGTGDTGQTHRMQEVTSFLSLARLSVSSSPAVEQGQPGSSLLSAWPAVLGCGFSSMTHAVPRHPPEAGVPPWVSSLESCLSPWSHHPEETIGQPI